MKKEYKLFLTLMSCLSIFTSAFAAADECVDAEVITPVANATATISGSFEGSTLSPSATSCSGTAVQDTWYQFTAISTQTRVRINAGVNNTSLGFSFYKGSCGSAPITCVNNSGALNFLNDSESKLFSDLEVGETYFVRVLNFTASNVVYPYSVDVESITPPVNDLCANAITLTSNSVFVGTQGTFANSGKEITAPSCYTSYYSQDVWFEFTALESTTTIEVKDLTIKSTIQLFNDVCGSTALKCASSNSNGTNAKLVAENLVVGNTYKFRVVNSTGSLSTLTFNVGVTHIPTAANDLIENAQVIVPATTCQNVTGTFSAATIAESRPVCSANASQDVWYKFVATEKLMRVVTSGPAGFDIGFELYKGENADELITCENDNGLHLAELYNDNTFEIGTTYFVRVFNTSSTTSTIEFSICVVAYPVPANNVCTSAEELTPALTCTPVSGTFSGATRPEGTTCTDAIQDVWFYFVATEPEMTVALKDREGLDHGFEIYKSSCSGELVACVNAAPMHQEESLLLEDLTIGETYIIRVLNHGTLNTGIFDLCVMGSPVETCPAVATITASSTAVCEGEAVSFISSVTNGGDQPVYTWYKNGITVGGNTSTLELITVDDGDVIYMTVTSNAECAPTNATRESNEITIAVSEVFTPIFDQVEAVCTGEEVVLPTTSINGYAGVWTLTNSMIGSNTYSFEVTQEGCFAAVSMDVTVTSISMSTTVNGKTIVVTSNGDSFQWINCETNQIIEGENGTTLTPSVPGSYAVIATKDNCEVRSECISVDDLGIEDMKEAFMLYPNPFASQLTIEGAAIDANYILVDVSGKVVSTGFITSQREIIELDNLNAGVYFLTIGENTLKVVKR